MSFLTIRDFVALMGPSDSGKTTLLHLIGGLDTPTAGSIVVDGQRIDQLSSGAVARWRAVHVGFVFQFYHFLPVLSAQRNVELPLLLTNLSAGPSDASMPRAPSPWSGSRTGPGTGQGAVRRAGAAGGDCPRYRVRLDAALVCDEPTGDLDHATADEILTLLPDAQPRAREDGGDGDAESQGSR